MAGLTAQQWKNGGEFLREQKETAVIGRFAGGFAGRFAVAERFEDVGGSGANGGDPLPGPGRIGFCEELGNLPPACSFASFAGLADEDDEEIEGMTGGTYESMRVGSDEVAESSEELQEQCGGIRFGMRSQGADDIPGEAMQRWFPQGGRFFRR